MWAATFRIRRRHHHRCCSSLFLLLHLLCICLVSLKANTYSVLHRRVLHGLSSREWILLSNVDHRLHFCVIQSRCRRVVFFQNIFVDKDREYCCKIVLQRILICASLGHFLHSTRCIWLHCCWAIRCISCFFIFVVLFSRCLVIWQCDKLSSRNSWNSIYHEVFGFFFK